MTGSFKKRSISIKPKDANSSAAIGEFAPSKKRGNAANLKPAWKKGESGNPAGRQIGSRNRLKEAFLNDLCAAWGKYGSAAIEKVAQDDASTFLRIVANLVPREVNGEDREPLRIIFIEGDENL